MSPARILVIRFSSAGDIVLLSALLRCMRHAWPQAHITLVTREDMADLVAENPHLSQIHALKRAGGNRAFRNLIFTLKQESYDLVVDAHGSTRSRIIRFFLRCPQTVAISKHSFRRQLLIRFGWNLLRFKRPMMLEYFRPLEKWGLRYDGQGSEIHIRNDKRERVQNLFLEKGFSSVFTVGIAPSSSYTKKAYPMESFRAIAQRVLQIPRATLVLFGGGDEERLILHDFSDRILDLQGAVDRQEAAAAARHCRLVLTNDSLMLHLAEAVGTDVLALFGPTVREFGYFPFRPGSKVFEERTWCRPCTKNGKGFCFRRKRYCMTRINPEAVIQEIVKRIA